MRREDAPIAHFIGELGHVALNLSTEAADQGVEAAGLGHVDRHVRAHAAAPDVQVAQFNYPRTWPDIRNGFVGLTNDSSAAVTMFRLYGYVHKTSVARRSDAGWGDLEYR